MYNRQMERVHIIATADPTPSIVTTGRVTAIAVKGRALASEACTTLTVRHMEEVQMIARRPDSRHRNDRSYSSDHRDDRFYSSKIIMMVHIIYHKGNKSK